MSKIKDRERDAILQSLRAGVVPKVGLQHIQVGRKDEISAVIKDFERIEKGSATIRFIIGKFGSGKSFFLNLARVVALEKKFVVVQTDITPEHRLHSTQGHARSLFASLMNSMATRAKPDGGAFLSIIERWISDIDYDIRSNKGDDEDVKKEIFKRLKPFQESVGGYDFANVIVKYLDGYHSQNDLLMTSAIRWLKGEYRLKTEANKDLGVRTIIDDDKFYEYLKLFAQFVKMAGFSGLIVSLDEMVVLSHRLNNTQARQANYEMILRILNDCLQGNVEGIGFMFGGTDDFLEDKRRGLFSYEALATRLAENVFAVGGLQDFNNPIIKLVNLSQEDLYVLFFNIRNVFAAGKEENFLVPVEALKDFMVHCSKTLGANYFTTPRDSVKAFVGFLSVLEQNPTANWRDMLSANLPPNSSQPDTGNGQETDSDLTSMQL